MTFSTHFPPLSSYLTVTDGVVHGREALEGHGHGHEDGSGYGRLMRRIEKVRKEQQMNVGGAAERFTYGFQERANKIPLKKKSLWKI